MLTDAPDYRYIGPVSLCPVCGANAFQTIISIDQDPGPDQYTPVAWFLDVECAQCGCILKIASPVDRIVREPALNAPEEE